MWALLIVKRRNKEIDEAERQQMKFMNTLHLNSQKPLSINIHQRFEDKMSSAQRNIDVSIKPTFSNG